jgi:hypothetical protein
MSGSYRGYTEAQKRATAKYKKNEYKRIPLDVKISEYENIKRYCDEHGEKINGFIRRVVREAIGSGSGSVK